MKQPSPPDDHRNRRTTSPFFVGVGGGTGSGKTTLVKKLVERLDPARVALIEHDSYYCPDATWSFQQRECINYDHPDSLETSLLVQHLNQLRGGMAAEIPTYDFTQHLRREETFRVQPQPIVIVEGILVLCEARLRECLNLKLFVWADDDIRFIRRLQRDLRERGRTAESVMRQYLETVKPMHERFVVPSMRHADLIVPGEGEIEPAIEVILARLEQVLRGDRDG